MKKTKIDWCDCTVNPVIGCKNGCAYCYAEKINKRFGFIPNWKEPQFFPERLKQLYTKTPKSIFMDSMSDVGLWSLAQIHKVAYSIKSNPQHNYLFLTKRPDLFIEKCKRIVEDANNGNIWVGVSANTRKDLVRLLSLPRYAHRFISIEPIMDDFGELIRVEDQGKRYAWINPTSDLFRLPYVPEVIIIGAETENRKNKVIPQKQWIDNIVKSAELFNEDFRKSPTMQKNGWYEVKIFMKESLREIMGEDFRQDVLPWEVCKNG